MHMLLQLFQKFAQETEAGGGQAKFVTDADSDAASEAASEADSEADSETDSETDSEAGRYTHRAMAHPRSWVLRRPQEKGVDFCLVALSGIWPQGRVTCRVLPPRSYPHCERDPPDT